MVLCNDIMWMIGQYVNTYRNNKKINDLFNIVPTETEIENTTDKYNRMKYKDIVDKHKDFNHIDLIHTYHNIGSGKNNCFTKQDRIKQNVMKELELKVIKNLHKLQDEIKYNKLDYPNIINTMTNDKLSVPEWNRGYNDNYIEGIVTFLQQSNSDFKTLQNKYLLSVINEKDKNTLQILNNVVDDYLEETNIGRTLTFNYLQFVEILYEKYDINTWNRSWETLPLPNPLCLTNVFDTFITKKDVCKLNKKYRLW